MLTRIIRHETLIFLIILSVVLRLPSLFEPYWYGDEGIYLTLGQALKQGLVWYRDIHDNKPPLLYLLAAIAGTVFWFRLLLMVWFGTTVAVFYRLMQKLLPKTPAAWSLATIIMIVLTTLFEGNIANAEIFIVLPVTTGILLALKARPPWGLIGLLFSAGFLFKAPAAFDFLALLIWLLFWKRAKIKNLFSCVFGFSLPIILSIAYYTYQGAFTPYVRSALMQNIGYLHSWGGGQSDLLIRLGVAILASLVVFRSLPLIWFVWAMFGALLSARPYPHYLIQPAMPLAILITLFFFNQKKQQKVLIAGVVMIAGIAYQQIHFWQYPVLGYYQNFIKYLAGDKPLEDYRAWFDERANQTYRLAGYIRQTTVLGEPIYIWGDEPYVYALANRLPVGRYTVAYHVIDFDGFNETMQAWDQLQPRLVAVMIYETRPFPELDARLAADYALVATIDRARVYRRLNGAKR